MRAARVACASAVTSSGEMIENDVVMKRAFSVFPNCARYASGASSTRGSGLTVRGWLCLRPSTTSVTAYAPGGAHTPSAKASPPAGALRGG